MARILKLSMVFLVVLLLSTAMLALVFPHAAVDALPGEVRARLPERLLKAVTTPLPTALPAPLATQTIVPTPIAAEAHPSPKTALSTSPATAPPQKTDEPAATRMSGAAPTTRPLATATSTTTPLSYPPQARLDGLQITPQKLNNCGPANLSINLNYHGLETTQFDVAQAVKPHYEDRNVSPEELVDFVNAQTPLRAAVYRGGDPATLKRLIAAGYPVIIEKGYEPNDWQGWMGHYLTLFGYDDASAVFLSMDTFLGPWDSSGREYSYEAVIAQWQHFNYTFMIVYPAQAEPEVQSLVGSELLDPAAMWEQAANRAQAQLEDDPGNGFAWFNLGAALTHRAALRAEKEAYGQAAAAFDQARLSGLPHRMLWYQFEPYEAYVQTGRYDEVLALTETMLANSGGEHVEETFLYRGQALQASGRNEEAARAYRQALALKPGWDEAQEALDNLALP